MKSKYTKEKLTEAVIGCTSVAQVCVKVGIKPASGSQTYLGKKIKEHNIDISHFRGKGQKGIKKGNNTPIEKYFNNEIKINSSNLRKRLLRDEIKKHACEICNLTEWNELPIPLELDHMDSNHWNNNLDNLQIICPNCHHQETISRKNK